MFVPSQKTKRKLLKEAERLTLSPGAYFIEVLDGQRDGSGAILATYLTRRGTTDMKLAAVYLTSSEFASLKKMSGSEEPTGAFQMLVDERGGKRWLPA